MWITLHRYDTNNTYTVLVNTDRIAYDEWATYDDLKAEIIAQAEEKGISPDWLVFE